MSRSSKPILNYTFLNKHKQMIVKHLTGFEVILNSKVYIKIHCGTLFANVND